MKRLLNKILKYLGLNLVKSKRARKPRDAKAICAKLSQHYAARKALNDKVLKEYVGSLPPHTKEELAKTPYVGYDCDRQTTCDENRVIDPQSYTLGKDNICIGVPQQPNSDNDVKGPTS